MKKRKLLRQFDTQEAEALADEGIRISYRAAKKWWTDLAYDLAIWALERFPLFTTDMIEIRGLPKIKSKTALGGVVRRLLAEEKMTPAGRTVKSRWKPNHRRPKPVYRSAFFDAEGRVKKLKGITPEEKTLLMQVYDDCYQAVAK